MFSKKKRNSFEFLFPKLILLDYFFAFLAGLAGFFAASSALAIESNFAAFAIESCCA